jgi:cell volume regulation protein A
VEANIYEILQSVQIDHIILGGALLILASVFTSKLAGNLGIPALLLFLLVGMLFGSDGPGGFYFDDPWLSQLMGVTALAIILFAGGLSTKWQAVKPAFWYSISLATAGVLITALLVGFFVHRFLGFPLVEAMLLGSVISSTDAAAVFGVLRSRKAALKGHLAPLLELESGANDPMAIFLTIGCIHLLTEPGARLLDMVPLFVMQMIVGAIIGLLAGRGLVALLNRINLEYEGLYPVLLLALVMFVYAVTALIRGSGFLAVYIAGIIMANSTVIHQRTLSRFFDSLAWLMQILMFLTLGLLVFPSRLIQVAGLGLAVSAFLMLVARPIAVFSLLSFTKLTLQQKSLISWVGLRGAVPIVLATMPLLAGVEEADTIFHVVFFVVLTSTLLQGTSIPTVARWLGVGADMIIKPRSPLEISVENMDNDLLEVAIPVTSAAAGKPIADLGLPAETLIVLINRQSDYIVPTGRTTVEAGDIVMVLGSKDRLHDVRTALVASKASHGADRSEAT